MQFFETVDKVVAPPEVHKKRSKPPALLSDVPSSPPSNHDEEGKNECWIEIRSFSFYLLYDFLNYSVGPKTSSLRRLPPPPPPPPLQRPSIARNTSTNESSGQNLSPKSSKDSPSTKTNPTDKVEGKGTFLKSFKIPKTLLRKRPVHAHGILARYPYNHYFIWMHVIVSFTLLVATCGIIGKKMQEFMLLKRCFYFAAFDCWWFFRSNLCWRFPESNRFVF